MKKRNEKPKKSKKKKSSKKNIKKDVTKQVGIFNDFVVYDKIDEPENKFDLLFNEPSDPFFKDWLEIQPKNRPTQSRFSDLFQEILENDKKLEKKKDNINLINNEINEIDVEDEKLLPNNLIEEYDDEEIKFDENFNINEKMKNLSINGSRNDSRSDIRSDISFDSNYSQNSLKNVNILSNNIINNTINNLNNINNINNIKIPNNNYLNINNNNNNMNNIMFNYAPNINNNNNINNFNNMNNYPIYYYQDIKFTEYTNSGFPSAAPTAPSSMDNNNRSRANSLYSTSSNSSGSFFGSGDGNNNIINNNNKNYDYYNVSNNKNYQKEPPPSRSSEKKFDLNIDVKRILSLEDRRTTLMIKNIPNKFKRDLLLQMINENFKEAYDLFILPTDANGYKNFGYSFINFTSSYYIPYFYFLFNNKKWPSTNSQKICEITYSKIQGRSSLLSHYQSKIIFKNNELKKLDNDNKYKIPNKYIEMFNSIYPNYIVEKYEDYFVTKMPFRY